jgi:hypothetical protein
MSALTPLMGADGSFEMGPETAQRMTELLGDLATPDIETRMVAPRGGAGGGTYTGADGLVEAWTDWSEPFERIRVKIEDATDSENCVLMCVRQLATSHHSPVEIETASAVVYHFDGDLISRVEFHLDRDSAYRSAGIVQNPGG